MRRISSLLFKVLLLLSFTACRHQQMSDSALTALPREQADSVRFAETHHYTQGSHFRVAGDSLVLQQTLPLSPGLWGSSSDSCLLGKGMRVVVVEALCLSGGSSDSVWVKLAANQEVMGWAPEAQFLRSVVPDNPVSRFIYTFSHTHLLYFIYFLGAIVSVYLYRLFRRKQLRFLYYRDIPSFYPALLTLVVSVSASLYAGLQCFAPDVWQAFYFHPTLNPFAVPFILSLFLLSVWAILICALAVFDEVYHYLEWEEALSYLANLYGLCMLLYLFFTLTIPYFFGYLFLAAYSFYVLAGYVRRLLQEMKGD